MRSVSKISLHSLSLYVSFVLWYIYLGQHPIAVAFVGSLNWNVKSATFVTDAVAEHAWYQPDGQMRPGE